MLRRPLPLESFVPEYQAGFYFIDISAGIAFPWQVSLPRRPNPNLIVLGGASLLGSVIARPSWCRSFQDALRLRAAWCATDDARADGRTSGVRNRDPPRARSMPTVSFLRIVASYLIVARAFPEIAAALQGGVRCHCLE